MEMKASCIRQQWSGACVVTKPPRAHEILSNESHPHPTPANLEPRTEPSHALRFSRFQELGGGEGVSARPPHPPFTAQSLTSSFSPLTACRNLWSALSRKEGRGEGALTLRYPSKICSYGLRCRAVKLARLGSTPNPDHKGTNQIGREVREEIG